MSDSNGAKSQGWLLPVLVLVLAVGVAYLAVQNLKLKRQLAELDQYYMVPRQLPTAELGGAAPPFEVVLPDGSALTLRTDSLSAPLLLGWLHTDCEPCRDNRQAWNNIADLFPGQFWAVSLDPPGIHDTAFSSDIVRFPVVAPASGAAPEAYRAEVTPTTLLVLTDGTIGKVWHGPLTDSVVGAIIALMGQPFAERR